ncbi:Tim44 domain-containing protein [Oricola nitratireducens]|uniref:Tim44 domain-containing protein n=1 Tax=Oricola nitratireducens TaxID=2775868 RepID=UPI0018671F34|nr:Tim44/TimA family putative adaptor protein [Oricola nitratireducens]
MLEDTQTNSDLWIIIAISLYYAFVLIRRDNRRKEKHGSLSFTKENTGAGRLTNQARITSPFLAVAAKLSFEEDKFLTDASRAFEFIVGSYAAGNLTALRDLLDSAVLEGFALNLKDQSNNPKPTRLEFVKLDNAEIVSKFFDDVAATIEVRFESEFFLTERRACEERPLPGMARLLRTADLWTFRRMHESIDPVWKVVATEPG